MSIEPATDTLQGSSGIAVDIGLVSLGSLKLSEFAKGANWENGAGKEPLAAQPWAYQDTPVASAAVAPAETPKSNAPVVESAPAGDVPPAEGVLQEHVPADAESNQAIETVETPEIASEVAAQSDGEQTNEAIEHETPSEQSVDVREETLAVADDDNSVVAESAGNVGNVENATPAVASVEPSAVEASVDPETVAVPEVPAEPQQQAVAAAEKAVQAKTVAPEPVSHPAPVAQPAPVTQPEPVSQPANVSSQDPPTMTSSPQPRSRPVVSRPRQSGGSRPTVPAEEYLAQLEQLVVDLNMELGVSQSEPNGETAEDQIHTLTQRLINLSIENSQLRRQLAMKPTAAAN
jgi:hypothetical protein